MGAHRTLPAIPWAKPTPAAQREPPRHYPRDRREPGGARGYVCGTRRSVALDGRRARPARSYPCDWFGVSPVLAIEIRSDKLSAHPSHVEMATWSTNLC